MKSGSPEVDAYIERAGEFAQPILKKFRSLIHKACPQVEEKLRWGVPNFDYRGPLAGMAAFKQHVRLSFWKSSLMADPHKLFATEEEGGMNTIRLTKLSEMPANSILMQYVEEAVRLNEAGVKTARPKRGPAKELPVPGDMLTALKKNRKALKTFEEFSPSHRNEYIEWITDAKQEATRERRIATMIEWLAEGKSRHWKYQ